MDIGRQAQTGQQGSSITLCIPSIHFSKFTLKFCCFFAVCIGEIFFCIQGIFFLHDIIKALIPHNDSIHDRERIILELILLKCGKSFIGGDDDCPGRWFQLAGKNAQEGRLAGTVCTNNAVAVAGKEFQVSTGEKFLTAEGKRDVVYCNHDTLLGIVGNSETDMLY